MAQVIDMRYRSRVESGPTNQRFLDATGTAIFKGFRLRRGTESFSITLSRDGFLKSSAVTPSGTRVTEDTELIDIVTIDPNTDVTKTRIDGVFLTYSYGTTNAEAKYVVVKGSIGVPTPPPNPAPHTHLLLGTVTVRPNGMPIQNEDIWSVPYGFQKLEVSGPSTFHGPVSFEKEVEFKETIKLKDGTVIGDPDSSLTLVPRTMLYRMEHPIIAKKGQQRVTLPDAYIPKTKTLFIIVEDVLQPPHVYNEIDEKTIEFVTPLQGGEEILGFWFKHLDMYRMPEHNHDDRYYTKEQMDERRLRFLHGTMGGPDGRELMHYLGHKNYHIVGWVPLRRTCSIGTVSFEKLENSIMIFNDGTYRDEVEVTYYVEPK